MLRAPARRALQHRLAADGAVGVLGVEADIGEVRPELHEQRK